MSNQTSYDLVPYESHPFPQTHPDRLGVIGTLLGMRPSAADKCRVLEIGCAAGGNLIPLALAYPESTFLGIDLSQVQIKEGQETIAALGLGNIELRAMSILDFPDAARREGETGRGGHKESGRQTDGAKGDVHSSPPHPVTTSSRQVFDYIICHGVYSWVPTEVQHKILEICKQHLAPQGIAYVSYNTYPGWHMRGMIRDMLQFHASQFIGPAQKVRQARNLLDFLGKAVAGPLTPDPSPQRGEGGNAYAILLRQELESFRRSSDSYLFHEHLEEVNEPIYFHQFVERAAPQGLRYLGEADLRVMVPGNFPPEIENVLQMVAQDAVHLEQYMDFLRNRMFRQTLLCHQNVAPGYALKWETVRRLAIASPATPLRGEGREERDESNVDGTLRVPVSPKTPEAVATSEVLRDNKPMQFETPDGIVLQVGDAIVKAAMLELGEAWPQALGFQQLLECAQARLGAGRDASKDAEILGRSLLQFYTQASTSLVEFWQKQPRFTMTVNERPAASALARHQAATKDRVTNLRHETAHLGDFERQLLRLLDGKHDRAALLAEMIGMVEKGELTVEKDGQPLRESQALREAIGQALESQLAALAQHALLTA